MISSLISLWSEKMLDMISTFLNLLRLVLWPNMCSILENISCTLECVFCTLGVEYSVYSILFNVSFKDNFPYWTSRWSLNLSGVWKPPTIIELLSISPFMLVNICFIYLGAPILGAHVFMNTISPYSDPFIII